MECAEHTMRSSCPPVPSLASFKGSDWIPPTDTMTWVRSGLPSLHTAGFPWLLPVQEPWERVSVFPHLKAVGEPCQSLQKLKMNFLCPPGGNPGSSVFSHWLLLDEANQQSGNYNLSVLKTITLKHSASTGFWYVYWQYMLKVLPFLWEY